YANPGAIGTSTAAAGAFTTLSASGTITLSAAAQSITHSGATSLTISSGGFVGIESVRFEGTNIGNSTDDDIIQLGSGFTVSVDANFSDNIAVTNNATVGGTLGVTGISTFTGAATFNGAVNINDVLHLTPVATPPSTNNGDIYIDSDDNHIYCRLNGAWVQLDN
ncbi:MAG: hypothetical protein B6I20_13340, partial [Bacteroidetes bacterium 4572_117]